MITYTILVIAGIMLLYKLVSAIERSRHDSDNRELRRHVIRMEGRR
jgi:hypothetical protein